MKSEDSSANDSTVAPTDSKNVQNDADQAREEGKPAEFGGRKDGLDPTRYGDWEKNGRCIDF